MSREKPKIKAIHLPDMPLYEVGISGVTEIMDKSTEYETGMDWQFDVMGESGLIARVIGGRCVVEYEQPKPEKAGGPFAEVYNAADKGTLVDSESNYPPCIYREDPDWCRNLGCQFLGRHVSSLTCRNCPKRQAEKAEVPGEPLKVESLKPCPFCGSEPIRYTSGSSEHYVCRNRVCPMNRVPLSKGEWEFRLV